MSKTTTMVRAAVLGLTIGFFPSQMFATDYLVHKDVANMSDGAYYAFKSRHFIVGENAFSSIWSVLAKLEDGDNIYFGPGAVGNITISKNNITLYGMNAFCDNWSGKRTADESSFTGTLNVANGVDGLTVNGFLFSGNGCVRNDNAGRGSTAVKNFSFIYNKCENSTLTRSDKTAIVYLGDAWRPTNTAHPDPSVWAANARYENITIAHNAFIGKNAANQPACVQIAGSAGTTSVVDNRFEMGGTSVSLFNTSGTFNIEHNRFTDVGKGLLAAGSATGEFCVRIYYIGARKVEPADGSICHNVFDGCQGQSGMFALIRFFSGDSNEAKYPPYADLKVNHNHFKNKTSYRTSDGHNYVFYGNDDVTTSNATVDWRFNHYDQSELEFAWIRPAWQEKSGRFYAGSSELFEHSTSDSETTGTGTLIDYYGATTNNIPFGVKPADGTPIKTWVMPSTTVVQSSDRDDVTNDWYFMQVMAAAYKKANFPNSVQDKPIVVMRHSKSGSSYSETVMYLDQAGHGSNMAVLNVDGTCYLVMGGCSGTGSTPTKICILPYVAGATVDVTKSSFTYGGKTYNIKHISNPVSGNTHLYPSIDRDNNLLVVRTRKGSVSNSFSVYDLMDAFNNPSTCKPIKTITIPCYTKAMTTSSREFLKKNDKGFTTWSDQGFTISGDYIYAYEGNGNEGYDGTPDPRDTSIGGDSKPILIINAFNWRTGEYIYRKAILKTKVYADAVGTNNKVGPYSLRPGEPESIKVHRDASGHPNLIIGVVSGASGARRYNLFAYRQKRVNGQGYVFNDHKPAQTISSVQTALTISSSGDAAVTALATTNTADVRDIKAVVVGKDGANFSVAKTAGSVIGGGHGFNVTFTPDKVKKEYNAFIRLSSPGANDVMIPVTGNYNGVITSVDSIIADSDESLEGAQYFDLSGRRLSEPAPGLNIVRKANGQTHKIICK